MTSFQLCANLEEMTYHTDQVKIISVHGDEAVTNFTYSVDIKPKPGDYIIGHTELKGQRVELWSVFIKDHITGKLSIQPASPRKYKIPPEVLAQIQNSQFQKVKDIAL